MKYCFKVSYYDFVGKSKYGYITVNAANIRKAWHVAVTYANNMTYNHDVSQIITIEFRGVIS